MAVLHFSTTILGNGPDKPLQTIPSLLLLSTALQSLEAKSPLEQGKELCWGGASAQGHDTLPGLFLLCALTTPGPSSQGNYWGKDPQER